MKEVATYVAYREPVYIIRISTILRNSVGDHWAKINAVDAAIQPYNNRRVNISNSCN